MGAILTTLLLAAIGLSACTSVHWEHPQTGQRKLALDSAECKQIAQTESWRYFRPPSLFGPFVPVHYRYGGYRHFRYWDYDPFFYSNSDFFRTAELRDFCLRSRGYQLVPDEVAQTTPRAPSAQG